MCERFPEWIKSPVEYYKLPDETQVKAFVYEEIREAEEAELAKLMAVGGIRKRM